MDQFRVILANVEAVVYIVKDSKYDARLCFITYYTYEDSEHTWPLLRICLSSKQPRFKIMSTSIM